MRPDKPVNPHRAPLAWDKEAFYDEEKLIAEMKRVFEICHGCRRCFNLCGVFPKLFSRIDALEGDVDALSVQDMDHIVSSCTLCDMCFAAKCPYVPPHPWNVDFPRLMLRYRAARAKKKTTVQSVIKEQLANTDRQGAIATQCPSIVNGLCACAATRVMMEKTIGIDRRAALPEFRSGTLMQQTKTWIPMPNPHGVAFGKTLCIYVTCFMNYYETNVAAATARILAHHGFSLVPLYKGCCGMPLLEQGAIEKVASNAGKVSRALRVSMEEEGVDTLISLTPSCTLMLRSEWPDVCPDNSDCIFVANHVVDVCAFLRTLAKEGMLAPFEKGFPEGIALHMACHVRAQNQGYASKELLSLLPETPLTVIERCSGHGGLFGFRKEHFEEAMQVGKPVVTAIQKSQKTVVSSECPLALEHIAQGCGSDFSYLHPIEILAHAWNLM